MTTVASFSTFISSLANEEVPGVDCIRAVVEDDGGDSDWAEVAKTSSHFLECFAQLLEPGDGTLLFGDERVRIDMVCCASKFYEAAFLLTAVKKSWRSPTCRPRSAASSSQTSSRPSSRCTLERRALWHSCRPRTLPTLGFRRAVPKVQAQFPHPPPTHSNPHWTHIPKTPRQGVGWKGRAMKPAQSACKSSAARAHLC